MTSISFKCAKINYILDKQYPKHKYDVNYKLKRKYLLFGNLPHLYTENFTCILQSQKHGSACNVISFEYILNKSENATLQLSIFYENVLDKKYLLKLNNVAQTSSKRIVETPPICLV